VLAHENDVNLGLKDRIIGIPIQTVARLVFKYGIGDNRVIYLGVVYQPLTMFVSAPLFLFFQDLCLV